MVKYLSFHNSSFALRYFLKKCKWQGHSVTHPLFYLHFLLCLAPYDVVCMLAASQCFQSNKAKLLNLDLF